MGQKTNAYQADISDNYDKIVKVSRRMVGPEPDKTLLKHVANHLQVEKHVRRTKIHNVLTSLIQEAENFHTERSRETSAPKQHNLHK